MEDHDLTTAAAPQPDPAVDKAVQLLKLITNDEHRRAVMERLSPEVRQRVEARLAEGQGTLAQFSDDVARRRLIREAAERMHKRRIEQVTEERRTRYEQPGYHGPTSALDQLRNVHPAALARAMQGERAEAWALVLDRLDDVARMALHQYLDHDARLAIEAARMHQQTLPDEILLLIEKAIADTVVERALREHHMLMTNSMGLRPATPAATAPRMA